MEQATYLERIIAEQTDLKQRIKETSVLLGYSLSTISVDEEVLLRCQLQYMQLYAAVLSARYQKIFKQGK